MRCQWFLQVSNFPSTSWVMSNVNVVIVKEYCFSDLFEIYNSKVLNVALIVWEWSMGVKPQTE